MANLTWGASRTSGTMLSWLFSGLFQRYPKLKIALSEGECGWMPYFLERAEQVLDKQRYWVKRGTKFMGHAGNEADLDTLDIRETFRNHIYGCIIEDHHAVKSLPNSVRTTSCARPTIRTPTRHGRTASRSPATR